MYTTVDKAIVAAVMAVIGLVNVLFGLHVGLAQDTVTMLVTLITPVLVHIVPNLPKDAS